MFRYVINIKVHKILKHDFNIKYGSFKSLVEPHSLSSGVQPNGSGQRLTGPAEVAMAMSKNRLAVEPGFNSRMPQVEAFKQSDSSKSDGSIIEVPSSIKDLQEQDSGNVKEQLFPTGIVADLQKNIESSSFRSYIGM